MTGWLFVLPALVVFTAVVMIPIGWSLWVSMLRWNGLSARSFAGFANYAQMLSDSVFRQALINTLVFSVAGSLVQLLFGMLMAITLLSLPWFRDAIRVAYFLPAVISSVAISQIFVQLLSRHPEGILNATLGLMGLEQVQQAFLANTSLTLTIVTLVDAYKFCAIYMAIYYSALMTIDAEVLAAAELDGATGLQQLLLVRLPMIKATIAVTVVLVVSGTLKGFDIPFIMTGGGPGASSELVSTYLYKTLFNQSNFGYGSAIAMFLVVECLIVVGILRSVFKSEPSEG